MTITLMAIGALLLAVGFVGCVVPVLPGPILGFLGLLALLPTDCSPSPAMLVALGALVAVVTVADYVVPAMGARKFNCTRWGTAGCFVGTLAGIFFIPLGILLGPFIGAMVGELIAGRSVAAAVRSGIGAFLGFLSGVFLKIVCCVVMSAVFALAVVRWFSA